MTTGPLLRVFVVALSMSVVGAVAYTPSGAQAATRDAVRTGSGASRSTILNVPLDPTLFSIRAHRSGDLAIVPGEPLYLSVQTTSPAGPIRFVEVVAEALVELGSAPWRDGGAVNGVQVGLADLLIAAPGAGTHNYEAIIDPVEALEGLTLPLTLDIQPVPMEVAITTAVNPTQAHHAVTIYSELSGNTTGTAPTGTFEWRDLDTSAVIATLPTSQSALALGPLPIGVRHFVVAYSGDTDHAPATSSPFTMTVTSDIVEASGVGRQYSSVYPVKDSYRDTVAIKGVRLEPISVAISIYSSTGKRVRSTTIARATGAYSYKWNGRTTGGSLLTAGRYKVVQSLTDAFGMKQSYVAYISLSHKRLVTHTKYVTKRGSTLTVKGHGGSGSVKVSTASGYARLKAGSGWAIAGWEFAVPSATVYKSVTFQIYAKTPRSVPPTLMGIQNFDHCARTSGDWFDGCFDHWRSVGNETAGLAWYSKTSKSSANRSGTHVRGMVEISFGTIYVYKARFKVVYAKLE